MFVEKLKKSLTLDEEALKMTEDMQHAIVKRNSVLARISFGNLIDFKNHRNSKYQKQVSADTFHNVSLKQRSFVELKYNAVRRLGLQEKFYQISAKRLYSQKEKILEALRNNKNWG